MLQKGVVSREELLSALRRYLEESGDTERSVAALLYLKAIFQTRTCGPFWSIPPAWFLVTDPVKRLAYRIFDPAKARVSLAKSKTLTDLTPQTATRS